METGGYGCCQMARAVCCSDKIHCCPHGTTCDVRHQKCVRSDGSRHSEMRRKMPSMRKERKRVACPDGSTCPARQTCCQLKNAEYGCCPFAQGTCCSDHLHCCPHNLLCDLQQRICKNPGNLSDEAIPWASALRPRPLLPRHDHHSSYRMTSCGTSRNCSADATCCPVRGSREGRCCPFHNGVCCRNGAACCPKENKCVIGEASCETRDGYRHRWTETEEGLGVSRLRCPDGSWCPAPGRCCPSKEEDGHFSCCPMEDGRCCGSHCCARGFDCAAEEGMCIRSASLKRRPSLFSP